MSTSALDATVLLLRPAKEREASLVTLLRSGATVVAADHPGNDYVGFADRFVPLPVLPTAVRGGSTAEIESLLDDVHRVHPFTAIITHYDYLLPLVGRLNERWGLRGHTEASGVACSDKHAQRVALDAAGVPQPRWVVCISPQEAHAAALAVGLPAVVKPADRAASCAVTVARDEAGLAAAVDAAVAESWRGAAIVEAYLDGPEFSVEAMVVRGDVRTVAVTDKGIGGRTGVLETEAQMPADLDAAARDAITATAAAAVLATGLIDGPSHTEVRLTSSGPQIVEVNGRVGGLFLADLVRASTGIDLYAAWLRVLHGDAPDLRPTRDAVACFRTYTDEVGTVRSVDVGRVPPELQDRLVAFRAFVAPGDDLRPMSNGNENRALVAAWGPTAAEAHRTLDDLQDALRIRLEHDEVAAGAS
ncbi:ATP-grasp domain-containing protein [Cellulomonas sp. CW35]|uniref:ATP-grasp domain-containing protein n=1 Tax=Cellulomonas sp. CW35 TaxID=3458249 RepID=UPI004034A1C1